MKHINYVRFSLGSILLALALSVLWLSCALAGDPSPLPSAVPAVALSPLAYIRANWSQIGGALFTLLFFTSEYMGQNPNIKSNGIFDFIRNWLKSRAGIV